MTNIKRNTRIFIVILALITAMAFMITPSETYAKTKKPAKVTGISISGGKKVNVSWKKAKRADYYQIYIRYASSKKWTKVASVKGTKKSKNYRKTTVASSKIKYNKSFQIKVRGINKVGKKRYKGKFSSTIWAQRISYLGSKTITSDSSYSVLKDCVEREKEDISYAIMDNEEKKHKWAKKYRTETLEVVYKEDSRTFCACGRDITEFYGEKYDETATDENGNYTYKGGEGEHLKAMGKYFYGKFTYEEVVHHCYNTYGGCVKRYYRYETYTDDLGYYCSNCGISKKEFYAKFGLSYKQEVTTVKTVIGKDSKQTIENQLWAAGCSRSDYYEKTLHGRFITNADGTTVWSNEWELDENGNCILDPEYRLTPERSY